MRSYFPRVGGKSRVAKQIVKLFPPHRTYIEPFCGAASCFFAKPPSSCEILNDLDVAIYDLFHDMKSVGEKVRTFDFTATRDEFFRLLATGRPTDPTERLLKNLTIAKNSFCGNRCTWVGPNLKKKNLGKFIKRNCTRYKKRLENVTILCKDYAEIVQLFDAPDALFYLDPPWVTGTTTFWGYNTTNVKKLLDCLEKITGKFVLSFQNTPQHRDIFKNFHIHELPTLYSVAPGARQIKTDLLITNFPICDM